MKIKANSLRAKQLHETLDHTLTIKVFSADKDNYHDIMQIEGSKNEIISFAQNLIAEAQR